MRMMIIKANTDTRGLSSRLLASRPDTLASLRRLNPHADLQKLGAGTLLLMPDGLGEEGSEAIAGESFDELAGLLMAGLEAAAEQANLAHALRLTENKSVEAALQSDPMKLAQARDPLLPAQVAQALEKLKLDASEASSTAGSLRLMQTQAKEELSALAKLLA